MIIELTPYHIRLKIGARCVTVWGDAVLSGFGPPDFVAYRGSITKWDPPDDGETIDEETRKMILETVRKELETRGMTLEVE